MAHRPPRSRPLSPAQATRLRRAKARLLERLQRDRAIVNAAFDRVGVEVPEEYVWEVQEQIDACTRELSQLDTLIAQENRP